MDTQESSKKSETMELTLYESSGDLNKSPDDFILIQDNNHHKVYITKKYMNIEKMN